MSNTVQSQREKLDKVYVCTRCSGAFLFRSDLEGHKELTGHAEAHTIPLETDNFAA